MLLPVKISLETEILLGYIIDSPILFLYLLKRKKKGHKRMDKLLHSVNDVLAAQFCWMTHKAMFMQLEISFFIM